MTATVETIAVGQPRTISWRGNEVSTSIFNAPVPGPVMARGHNLDGDHQSDRRAHGGEYKAVYAYAAEHYDWWATELGHALEPANFGENLTLRGFDETAVSIGDVFRVGGALLEATAPRLPCYKLGIRFGDPRMVKRFARAARWGIYLRIAGEGAISIGDEVTLMEADPERLPVYDIARVYMSDRDDGQLIRRLASHNRLDPSWRSYFEDLSSNG